ncbi:hypothetical protein GDO81_013410 [Engystomops pustulosus]|uniref:DUF4587 domain-containing protein n=1 Tax=Engystomops pustulosus TaxID=76066 RepID=A0AAV7AZA9_ENGPU|nr:hypothetical protein GDO81_013410 [Engystomops pustulosus]
MFQPLPVDTPYYTSPGIQIISPTVPQQPTIIQQLPTDFTPPLSHPIRHGRAKEDLIELMMIQNAQMHQVIMNNMTMAALSSFGYGSTPPNPMTTSATTSTPECHWHCRSRHSPGIRIL